MTQDEKVELVARLTQTEVVSLRLGDTPDWVWSPPETAPHDYYVELLLDAPDGLKRAVGIYREGTFFGKTGKGWFAPEKISENGRPTHGMYLDGFVKGWRPYRYHLELAAALSTIPVEEPTTGDAVSDATKRMAEILGAEFVPKAALAQSQPTPDAVVYNHSLNCSFWGARVSPDLPNKGCDCGAPNGGLCIQPTPDKD